MQAIKGIKPEYLIGGVVLAGLVWFLVRGAKGTAQDVGSAIGGAVVGAVDGVLSGSITGLGESFGIPQTNMTECQKAKAEGRTWDASFACPAGDFLGYLWE